MPWTEPTFDRTALDVAERLPKAFFNVADWVRINGNTHEVRAIVNILLSLDIPLTALSTPTMTSIPSVGEINAFIANIERLRAAVCLPTATGVTPLKCDYVGGNGAESPDYQAVNAWERDLHLIRELLRAVAEYSVFCGAFVCGQPRLYANRFRAWSGYVPEAYDPRRLGRSGVARAGGNLGRQNRWRSSVDERKRLPRLGVAACGTTLTRQNKYRRYA